MSSVDLTGDLVSQQQYGELLKELELEDKAFDSSITSLELLIDDLTSSVGKPSYNIDLSKATGLSDHDIEQIESEALIEYNKEFQEIEELEETKAIPEKNSYEEYCTKAEQTLASYRANAERARIVKKEKKRKERILKIEIQRRAFAQNQIDLSQLIPQKQLQLLVSELTKNYENLIKHYDNLINRRFTRALRKHIPYQLRVYHKAYPQSFKVNPGFMYTASREYGGGHTHWVSPNLPYFIPQFKEIDCMRATHADWLPSIDRLIAKRYDVKDKLTFYEMKFASKLAGLMPHHTYFNLLKHHPLWFIILYEKVTGYSLGVADKVQELQPAYKNKIRLSGSIC